ncbi:hypothetical protein [Methylocucumis oryzae]|uniref:hypothetical protein n=1 Tax=Methylocucumis oryzae TaxID=1632867 RepID=UPI00069649C6|nr:hypothetical protein [Methylocucumis oryzae]
MLTIHKLNEIDAISVYGLVTNGKIWEIAKLEQQTFVFYNRRFVIEDLENLFNAIVSVLEACKLQLVNLGIIKKS